MENIRVMLAAASVLIGLLLLIIAIVRTRKGTKTGTSAHWVFGGLFVLVAFVLWLRGIEHAMEGTVTAPESISESRIESSPPTTHGTSVPNPETSSGSAQGSDREPMSESPRREISTPTKETTAGSPAPGSPSHQPPTARSVPRRGLTPAIPPTVADSWDWRDRIHAAIEVSFEWIEEFFDKYATPVPVDDPAKAAPALAKATPEIEFPAIEFAPGTADLSRDSISELKKLAATLAGKYGNRTFEIQAYVDSIGPEAFNFVLTQARADAVRDLLIAEGVDENHLIARGYGTGKDPEFADARIEFIVR